LNFFSRSLLLEATYCLLRHVRVFTDYQLAGTKVEEGAGDSSNGFGGSGKLSDAIVAECRSEFATHVATLRAFIEEHSLRKLSPQGEPGRRHGCARLEDH